MDDPQLEKLMIHVHCETCIKINKCTVRPQYGESCEIVSCSAKCGAKFHTCKAQEHKLLCLNEKVQCINAINGCPLWMPRRQRGSHLETCPASVVHCTMEWNRWPVCSRERQLHIPFHQPNPHVRPGQLDVSLALRDQRMLNEWVHAPRKARQAMRNGLTPHFPAVPFQLGNKKCDPESELAEANLCMDEETLWELRKAPPGLKRSVCSELYRASKQTTESLSAALNIITNHALNAESKPKTELPLPMEEDKENFNGLVNGWSAEHHHLQKASKNGTGTIHMELDSFEAHPEAELNYGEHMELGLELPEGEPVRNYDVLFVDNTIVSEISSASMTDHARKQPSPLPPPPPTSPPMFVNLGLDLTLESITRYQTKPKSMYTFLCAQEFRRDEYSWHYQNVHSDIHGGLNGWLEQRCPLSHYGCMFSVRRFFPASPGSTLVHNDILESFGVKPKVPNLLPESLAGKSSRQSSGLDDSTVQSSSSSSSSIPSFSEFPFEVLQHIARFLDSFSLCNLAMTSHKLREVCCSLLEERGIVVQQWVRHWNGERGTWKIAYKRWYFSTAFTPVLWWGFEDKESMANHLQKCVYFQRNVKTEPYYYPMQAKPDQRLYEKLYTAAKRSASESQATKL